MNEVLLQELELFLSKNLPLPPKSEIGGKMVLTTVARGHIEFRIAFHVRDEVFAAFSYNLIGLTPKPGNIEFRPELGLLNLVPDEDDLGTLAIWLIAANR